MPLNINNVDSSDLYGQNITDSTQNTFNYMTGCAFVKIMRQISDLSKRAYFIFGEINQQLSDVTTTTKEFENRKYLLENRIKEFKNENLNTKKYFINYSNSHNPFNFIPTNLTNILNKCENHFNFYSTCSDDPIQRKRALIINLEDSDEIEYIMRSEDHVQETGNDTLVACPRPFNPAQSISSISSYNFLSNLKTETIFATKRGNDTEHDFPMKPYHLMNPEKPKTTEEGLISSRTLERVESSILTNIEFIHTNNDSAFKDIQEVETQHKKPSFDGLMAELSLKMSKKHVEPRAGDSTNTQNTLTKPPPPLQQRKPLEDKSEVKTNSLLESIRQGVKLNSVSASKPSGNSNNGQNTLVSALSDVLKKRRVCMNEASNDSDDLNMWSD